MPLFNPLPIDLDRILNSLHELFVRGMVLSGKGEGREFVGLSWVREQVEEKLGFTPFPGTLNVKLTARDCARYKEMLKSTKSIEILPVADFSRGRCIRAYLSGDLECAAVVPDVAGYDACTVELIAPANLREKLHIDDGETIEIRLVF